MDRKLDHVLIYTTPTVGIIRRLHVCSTLVGCLEAILLPNIGGSVDLGTLRRQIEAPSCHITREFHIIVYGIIHSFYTVRIVHGKLRVVRCLCIEVQYAITDSQRVKH